VRQAGEMLFEKGWCARTREGVIGVGDDAKDEVALAGEVEGEGVGGHCGLYAGCADACEVGWARRGVGKEDGADEGGDAWGSRC
jgi:hypothetical protein